MIKFIVALTCLCSTGYACHYCDDCRNGIMSEEDHKVYIDSGSVYIQDGQILWLDQGKCSFLQSIAIDDHGVFVWSDQIICVSESK